MECMRRRKVWGGGDGDKAMVSVDGMVGQLFIVTADVECALHSLKPKNKNHGSTVVNRTF